MADTYQVLYNYISSLSIINTHSHHLADKRFEGFDLDDVLRESYINWSKVEFGPTPESRSEYLKKVRYNSYFVWLEKSVQRLYGISSPITAENWDEISAVIRRAHAEKDFHIRTLKEKCRYESVIVDTYWNPGSDNGHPDIFRPTFRVDPFFYAYSRTRLDHDGNNANMLYGDLPMELDAFIGVLREQILLHKNAGCVAIKAAIAYDRGLDIAPVTKEQAKVVFEKPENELTEEEIKHFQDYLFLRVCEMAAEFDLPLQCHTGMGQLRNTRPAALQYAIAQNPNTKFVLFHGGFPWTDDMTALLHFFTNVYADTCWLPILSPTVAERVLNELVEVATADKIFWGCDTWTGEESYGAYIAMREVFAKVMAKKIESGYFTMDRAKELLRMILHDNAARLFYHE